MPTQVLYGEQVEILDRRPGWYEIAVPDQPSPLNSIGYPGWVRSWQLALAPLPPGHGSVTVTVRSAKLSNGTEVSFATRLPLVRQSGAVDEVETPSGIARLPKAAVAPLPNTRADLVATAKEFLGLHYLWGGLSAWGYDCSGLTWAVYRAHGITIPRDADAQFAAGTPIAMSQLLPGDLLFYERPVVGHVTMYIGGGMMIEAPNSTTVVRIVPVSSRADEFRGARRFFTGP
jgi:cell wall-associated NlpC family hydrolase